MFYLIKSQKSPSKIYHYLVKIFQEAGISLMQVSEEKLGTNSQIINTYFIINDNNGIESKNIKLMTRIREKEKLAKLIYLTVHPNYQLLYRSHLSLLAVIDLENTQSWQDLDYLISDFLVDTKKELD